MKSKLQDTQLKNEDGKDKGSINLKPEINRSFGTIDLWNRQKKRRTFTEMRRHII